MSERITLTIPLVLLVAQFASADDLESRIKPVAEAHKGKIAVAIVPFQGDSSYFLNADEPMPTASLIKLAIMVETFRQADEGKVKLDELLTLKDEDKVPGSGVLTDNFSPGAKLALFDCVRLMITVSDNTATNMVLDRIGLPSTNGMTEKLGFPHTRVNAKVFKASTTTLDKSRSDKFGLGSTTARETVQLLSMIENRKAASEKSCTQMLEILLKNQDNEKVARFLPAGVSVAHKSGAVTAVRNDAGIVYIRDPESKARKPLFAICVLTDGNEDKRWSVDNAAQITLGKIARAAYDHFSGKK